MNGRQITSWGINPRLTQTGYVVRAFFDATKYWENSLGKNVTIEGRHFRFSPAQEPITIANDGGIIEFKVYRAVAKKRRPIQVEQYQDQSNWGVR